MSLLILGGAFAAALTTIGSARASQRLIMERRLGLMLAEDLMEEILAQETYKEGDTFGREDGERAARRNEYDDIDDYENYSLSPPRDMDFEIIPGTEGYSRRVAMYYVDPTDTDRVRNYDTGLLRIFVRVRYDTRVVAEVHALRSSAYKPAKEGG